MTMSEVSAASAPVVIVTETLVLPSGMPADHLARHHFALFVRWDSGRGWLVTTLFRDEMLSVKGRKWCGYVTARQRRHYRFESYGAALSAAIAAVDSRQVDGRTWEQWR